MKLRKSPPPPPPPAGYDYDPIAARKRRSGAPRWLRFGCLVICVLAFVCFVSIGLTVIDVLNLWCEVPVVVDVVQVLNLGC